MCNLHVGDFFFLFFSFFSFLPLLGTPFYLVCKKKKNGATGVSGLKVGQTQK
jgi:hypothetical protein